MNISVDIELCKEMYIQNRWGLSRMQKEFALIGKKYSIGFLANRLREVGIALRSSSQSATFRTGKDLDHSKSYITEDIIDAIDGWMLGDGNMSATNQTARINCVVQHKEFCDYTRGFFIPYFPSDSRFYPPSPNAKDGCKGVWAFATLSHPELYYHYKRWYSNGIKAIPVDVRVTPASVLLWYLGDGSLVVNDEDNSAVVRLSTDCFTKEHVNLLIDKLAKLGIDSSITSENRIRVTSAGIKPFFDFIGRKSPIECYQYKFGVPEWRYNTVRASVVAKMLNINLSRLQHMIKIKEVPVIRLWENGRPLFDKKAIERCRELIKEGRLY